MTFDRYLLETHEVTKQFGGLNALNDVDFSLNKGEVRGIIGPNGAGKTTLFNVLTGELKPTSGKIFFNGQEITNLPPHIICRKGLSRTFQLTLIFPDMTVYDSIWIGVNARAPYPWNPFKLKTKVSEVHKNVQQICEMVGLWEVRDENVSNLSYGDQKVLEIALALSLQPTVLLLDEPTQGVGPEESENIVDVVEKVSKDMTVILIEHSIDIVLRLCHKISVLNQGRIISEGTPEEISHNKEVQRVYLGEAT